MKTLKLVVLIVLFYSCQKEDEYSGNYSIKGNIQFDNGINAENTRVYLNNEFRTTTNSEGNFTLNDINAGKYTLKASSGDSSSGYSEIEIKIDLKGADLNLDNILLPIPVKLLEPTDVTSNSLKLTWTKCNASDFREYKIYIHNSSALDESTGTLLHIATDVNDTVLTIKYGDFWWAGSSLTPNTTYYLRVFVTNSYGRMSGSNIMKVKTKLWDNSDEFTNSYNLQLQSSFAAQGNLTGIAWDGNYFWMLYFEELGGFYDNNRITLVKYDYEHGTTLDTIVFDDSNYFPAGITWDGTSVWISFGTYVQSVNLENNTLDKSYYAGQVTVDLAWDNENLLLLDTWNKVTFINPINGNISRQFDTPFKVIGYSGEKGIAYREGEIWIINNWHNEICILDNTGKHIGVAEVDFLQGGLVSGHIIPMCFMDNKLIIAFDSQVRIYSIEPIN